MNSAVVNLIKTYLKDLPENISKEILAKLTTVKDVAGIAAVFEEYKIDFDKEACNNLLKTSGEEKGRALSDEDLELVTGGCDDDWKKRVVH